MENLALSTVVGPTGAHGRHAASLVEMTASQLVQDLVRTQYQLTEDTLATENQWRPRDAQQDLAAVMADGRLGPTGRNAA